MQAQIASIGERGCVVREVSFRFLDRSSGLSLWRGDCVDGRSYMMSIRPDKEGSAKVANCADMQAIGVSCYQ